MIDYGEITLGKAVAVPADALVDGCKVEQAFKTAVILQITEDFRHPGRWRPESLNFIYGFLLPDNILPVSALELRNGVHERQTSSGDWRRFSLILAGLFSSRSEGLSGRITP